MSIMFSLVMLITSISITVNYAWADNNTHVLFWTKKLSDWWHQGKISDVESVNAFQYLINNRILYVPGLSFNDDVSYDQKVRQTRLLTSFIWDESDKPAYFKLKNNITRDSKLYHVYVRPAPAWAPYANDLVPSATNYWKDKSNATFSYSSEPNDASITIMWLKEPDSKYAGYMVDRTVVVALGDSRCDGVWHAYDTDFVTATLTHELGHALGFAHSDNMGDIMYPVISGAKYAPIKQTFVLGPNESIFVYVCTFRHTGTFHYTITSDDAKNPLTVFFIPSKVEYNKFVHGEKFNHYTSDGCFGTASISYDNRCSDVSNEGGLIISALNHLQSQQKVILTLEEE